jgi:hypothetical protein
LFALSGSGVPALTLAVLLIVVPDSAVTCTTIVIVTLAPLLMPPA